MDTVVNTILFLSGIISISQSCVTENKDALKECVDPLKLALSGSGDVNEVFCRYVFWRLFISY